MILINRGMKGNKYKDVEIGDGDGRGGEAARGPAGDKKPTKFNLGSLFKKIALPMNKKSAEGGGGAKGAADASLSPTTKSPRAKCSRENSGRGSCRDDEQGEDDEGSAVADRLSFLEGRERPNGYTSFTSKCISLQGSEMTSTVDLDEQSVQNYTQTGAESRAQVNGNSEYRRKSGIIDSTFAVSDDDTDADVDADKPEQAGDHNEEEEDDDDEGRDVVEYLSETESDVNFNPHQEESINDYKIGGYHPVFKGETYYSGNLPNREYIVLRKLGWGHFSTVWLAKSRYNPHLDTKTTDKELIDTNEYYVALKFVKSNDNYLEAAEDEIKLLRALDTPLTKNKHLKGDYAKFFDDIEVNSDGEPIGHPGYNHVMRLLDDFNIKGPNGNHICMVFEVLGENVLNLLYKFKTIRKELKNNSEEKETKKSDNNKNFKLFSKSKLSLGLLNSQPKKQDALVDSCNTSCNSIMSSSSDSLIKLIENLETYGGIPIVLVKQIVRQILLAVDYMHHCGVIHTDLKPENILVEIKDVNNLIKIIENDRVSKFYAKYKSRNNSSISNKNFSNDKTCIDRTNSAKCSNSRKNSITYGSYRKSRNSISSKTDLPIKTSKPLSSTLSTDTIFKEISFSSNESHYVRKNSETKMIDSPISPKHLSILTSHVNVNKTKNADELISIKIADLGNATFSHYHFTNQIQTRQYRAPEILLKHKTWGASADMWSIGCIIFELITGDYLFDPHSGNNFDKDEDHLAQMIELLGKFPSNDYLMDCEHTPEFFNIDSDKKCALKNISKLKYWSLYDVLVEKYQFDPNDVSVKLLSDLILKCLTYDLDARYDCKSLLGHPWLNMDIDLANFDMESLDTLPMNHDDIPGFTS